MAMKISFVGLATAVLAVGASVGSVVAQTKQPLDWCGFKDMEGTLSDDTLADLIISGCTAVIESGKLTGKDLANIFNNRGNAYAAMKREFDRAIADYDQAIQLAPNLPGPYLNRAQTKSKKGDRAGFDADIARFKQLCDADRAACGFPPVPVSKDHR